MFIPGVTCVIQSFCGVETSATLSLYVSRKAMLGEMVQARVCARAADPVVSSIAVARAACHALAAIAVAVVRRGLGSRHLVEQRHHDRTALDGGERGFENAPRGFVEIG